MSDPNALFTADGGDCRAPMGRFMGNGALYFQILPKLFQDSSLQKWGTVPEDGDLNSAIMDPLRPGGPNAGYFPPYQTVQEEFQWVREPWQRLEKGL